MLLIVRMRKAGEEADAERNAWFASTYSPAASLLVNGRFENGKLGPYEVQGTLYGASGPRHPRQAFRSG
jgi:hypothetical protein